MNTFVFPLKSLYKLKLFDFYFQVQLSGQGEIKGLDEITSKSMFPGFVPNTSAPFDRGIGNYIPNKAAPSR